MSIVKSYFSAFSVLVFTGVLIILFSQCVNPDTSRASTNLNLGGEELLQKQKGAHIFGYLDSVNLIPFKENNINWITIVPYAAQKDIDSPEVVFYRGDSLENARKDSLWKSQIDIAHANGFKVFLKPHIWLTEPTNDKWRSDIYLENEEDWHSWQQDYTAYILNYARIAQANGVDLFCIGAELSRLTIEKTEFWHQLIKQVKKEYTGQLTYAANWNSEYQHITFWDELDFIGVQAYFPLAKKNNPSLTELSEGWEKYVPSLEATSKEFDRKIIFTEMGYKSTDNSAIEPWSWVENVSSKDVNVSLKTQANCYQAFFNSVWNKEWFAGVHIWQMRCDYIVERPEDNLDFSPQGKLAEKVIAKGFE